MAFYICNEVIGISSRYFVSSIFAKTFDFSFLVIVQE